MANKTNFKIGSFHKPETVSNNLKTTKTDEKNPIIDLLDCFNIML